MAEDPWQALAGPLYLPAPEPLLDVLCRCSSTGGADALAAFATDREVGVLGTSTRGDTVELGASLRDPYRQLSRVFHLVGTSGS